MKQKPVIMTITVEPPESFNRRVITRLDVGYDVLYDFPKPPYERLVRVLSIKHVLSKGWLNHHRYTWDLYYVKMRICDGQPGAGRIYVDKHIPADNVTYVRIEPYGMVSSLLKDKGVLKYQE
ncbi:MAG: hypothetical protein JRN21_09490 [Nitrososphaerota archaeon]|nr:hypothetical protein [Nitrososphaerota archaeon]